MSRRKAPDVQTSLFGATSAPIVQEIRHEVRQADPKPDVSVAVDDAPDLPERPKLRLVERGPSEDVTVEPDATYEGMFWIDCVRHDGTTRGMVRVTRRQLEMLVKRGAAALEVGK